MKQDLTSNVFFIKSRSNVLKKLPRVEGRPGAGMEPFDFETLKENLQNKYGTRFISEEDVVSAALYPKVTLSQGKAVKKRENKY